MRAVVSRVSTAAVTVDGEPSSARSGRACCHWSESGRDDDVERPGALARKIHELRSSPVRTARSRRPTSACRVLVVSQFTLYADTRKGRRPSWQDAAPGDVAEPLVDDGGRRVASPRLRPWPPGVFGARMQVASVNEGPMTLLLEI